MLQINAWLVALPARIRSASVAVRGSSHCSLALYTSQPPKFVDCVELSLLPFNGWYPKLDVDFAVTGLDPDANKWNHVSADTNSTVAALGVTGLPLCLCWECRA